MLSSEAMMEVNKEKYAAYIRSDIRKNYTRMLDFGSDTVWETQRGAGDVGVSYASSLCHGWSAVPVYIYHKLGIVK